MVFFFNDTATTEIYTLSLHDALPICTLISDSRDVGATGIFDANLAGRKLTFRLQEEGFTDPKFIDNQTGSVWNIFGKATSGPLSGSQLTPIIHGNHFWFTWGAFKPNTVIYRGPA